jgi:hypothetical protein
MHRRRAAVNKYGNPDYSAGAECFYINSPTINNLFRNQTAHVKLLTGGFSSLSSSVRKSLNEGLRSIMDQWNQASSL